MKKTSLMRALFVAGVMAAAGGMAQADAIFYPDGTRVEMGENAVESGLADTVLASSATTAPDSDSLLAMGVLASQDSTMIASSDESTIDTTVLGAGPSDMTRTTTTTVTTTSPVYVFPNINFDRSAVRSQHHPMMSHLRPMGTTTESFTSVPPSLVVPDTTSLGAGPSTWSGSGSPDMGHEQTHELAPSDTGGSHCGASMTNCGYLPD